MSKTLRLLQLARSLWLSPHRQSLGLLQGEAFEDKRRKSEGEFAFVFHVELE